MSAKDEEKRLAAEAAVGRIEDGMRLGLGSGTTALFAVRALGVRVREGLRVTGVPTSRETEAAAREEGIPLTTLEADPHLDLAIDGADEADARLRLIKGGGGALLREKIVASAAKRVLIVLDQGKVVESLGAFPLPVEVIPFGEQVVAERIRSLDGRPRPRLAKDGRPFVTDEGHHILDCAFGEIEDPERLAAALSAIPGVVEHGLFLGLAHELIVAAGNEVRVIA